MLAPILELVDVHTYYGKSYVLQGVSLATRGAVVALLGRNGMGKTTTIRSIMGLTPPARGMVRFKGRDITGLPIYAIAQLGIGLVPQGRRIFPSLSVRENLTMSARVGPGPAPWTLDRVFSLFPILGERAHLKGTSLSGGEQQMLAIGRALMTNPELLLMDEPSEGLAPRIVQDTGRIINELKAIGLVIVLIEQNLSLALAVADYVFVIENGIIVHESTVDEFRQNHEVRARYLGIA
jgi:branched-chain amino acid transport system ATP-binding protein